MCVHLTLSLSEMHLLRTQCVVDHYIPHVCMYVRNRRFVLDAAQHQVSWKHMLAIQSTDAQKHEYLRALKQSYNDQAWCMWVHKWVEHIMR